MTLHPELAAAITTRLVEAGLPTADVEKMNLRWAHGNSKTTLPQVGDHGADRQTLIAKAVPAFEILLLPPGRDGRIQLLSIPTILLRHRTVAVVSSRLGKHPEIRSDWFRALRAVCAQVTDENGCLFCVAGTAATPLVIRAAELLGTYHVLVKPAAETYIANWWEQTRVRSASPRDESAEVHLSPTLHLPAKWTTRAMADVRDNVPGTPHESSPGIDDSPQCDWLSIALPHRIFALHVRGSGNIEKLLAQRLATCHHEPVVRVAVGDELVRPRVRDRLMKQGAVAWALFDGNHELRPRTSADKGQPAATIDAVDANVRLAQTAGHSTRIVPVPAEVDWNYLTHCTRRRAGPWPTQSEKSYLDDLILARQGADHSPLAALRHIVTSHRLVASGEGIRGGTPVVCLTAVPLGELTRLRIFRPHRGRWDFQPYGVCIRQSALCSAGARPVQYADSETWQKFDPVDQPFFQLHRSTTPSGHVLDWTAEQEWRHIGDISLDQFESHDILVFVPTRDEAAEIADICKYQVSVLGAEGATD